jgi:quercetin dioxygenase-like cupin family protein
MKNYLTAISILFFSINAQSLTISKRDSREVIIGPKEIFTGKVSVETISKAEAPARTNISFVTFSPGARSAWHTHPLGQTLIVTKGTGRIQALNEPIKEIRGGDVIWTPPGQKHWHGASPDSEMSHYSVVEAQDGKQVDWLEKVTDEQYKNFKK